MSLKAKFDVFISYLPNSKTTDNVLNLAKIFKNESFSIWLANEQMRSLSANKYDLDLAFDGIDDANTFLCCLTYDYLNDECCMQEMNYALKLKKHILLLLFENIKYDQRELENVAYVDRTLFNYEYDLNKVIKLIRDNVERAFQSRRSIFERDHTYDIKKLLELSKRTHFACRTSNIWKPIKYRVEKNEREVVRTFIRYDHVPWKNDWRSYPYLKRDYTSPKVLSKPVWADPHPADPNTKWNNIDNKIDRRSHEGNYKLEAGVPLNPIGRTGIAQRGHLGRWGPNHAADPIVTRWKRDNNRNVIKHRESQKPILQFVSIQRHDTKEWAIPGGMCDPGEKVSATMKREFMEEALNSNEMTEREIEKYKELLMKFFNAGSEIYRGYVDDPRNTDNAWMETIAFNFHDEDDKVFGTIKLNAGDDASHVQWMDIDSTLKLYASHKDFIETVVKNHKAHW